MLRAFLLSSLFVFTALACVTGPVSSSLDTPAWHAASGSEMTLKLEWSDVTGASAYRLVEVLDQAADGAEIWFDMSLNDAHYTLTRGEPGMATFMVQALNDVSTSEFSERIKVPIFPFENPDLLMGLQPPALNAPEQGFIKKAGSPLMMSWSSVEGADLYRIQVSRDLRFDDLLFSEETPTLDVDWDHVGLGHGVYFWRVAAIDPLGEQSAYGEVRQLTVVSAGGFAQLDDMPVGGTCAAFASPNHDMALVISAASEADPATRMAWFNTENNTWTDGETLPIEIKNVIGGVVGDTAWILGDGSDSQHRLPISLVDGSYEQDCLTGGCSFVASRARESWSAATAMVVEDEVFLIGGWNGTRSPMDRFSASERLWRSREEDDPAIAMPLGHRAFLDPQLMAVVVVGGYNSLGGVTNQVSIYEIAARRWFPPQIAAKWGFLPEPRADGAVWETKTGFHLAGGVGASGIEDGVIEYELGKGSVGSGSGSTGSPGYGGGVVPGNGGIQPVSLRGRYYQRSELPEPRRNLCVIPLSEGRVVLAGGLDNQDQPAYEAWLYVPELDATRVEIKP